MSYSAQTIDVQGSVSEVAPVTVAVAASTPVRAIDVHCGWGATAAAPRWNEIGTIRAALAERGIGQAFLAAALAQRYDLCAGNDALAGALTDAGPGAISLSGWLVIHPSRAADSNTQMRKHLYREDFIGAALYADPLTGDPVTLRDYNDVINSFRRYSKPILIQTHTAEAMRYAVEIAETLSGIKIIASGMGGDEWNEAIPYAAHPLNLYLDISGALAPEKVAFAMAALHGTRKLLFASGAPHTDPAAVLGMLDDLELLHDDRERILYTNAARLFHLGPGLDAPMSLAPMPVGDTPPPAIDDLLATLGQ